MEFKVRTVSTGFYVCKTKTISYLSEVFSWIFAEKRNKLDNVFGGREAELYGIIIV